ncbi:pyrimidine 5'-nucleotidase [Mesobaculum littorinae]|uniref:Pyrimidine 5'-nucleotidase n=1 Tax=Mesobaculum littorinae TaxID=2486419 RepID=A0A438AJE7_9RHOB|nr:pyrimidine 5'-nucleotidase [Mesobaculum littorinae]RVV98727.1 pyrimidine 5'-nucleotidase [Mesobaculum littorinae]
MVASHFSHIRTWVFDLDNTLYPPSARLFDQMEVRMTAWVMRELGVDRAEADRLRHDYWVRYGTTLAGLMALHGVDPDAYLEDVHAVTLDHIEIDALLVRHIAALPGRRVVFTNGSGPYAARVLAARGLDGLFDAVYGVEHAGFRPKPEAAAYDAVFGRDGLVPRTAAMFDDDPRNLAEPHRRGLRTVHVAPAPMQLAHIHHHTDDLTAFLGQIVPRREI